LFRAQPLGCARAVARKRLREDILKKSTIFGAALAALIVGASQAFAAAPAQKIPAYITAAVADPNRPEADTKRDADRKPAESIAFAGIKPGDRVVDMIPGSKAYFTKIFSKVVGPKGWVYAYFPSDLDELYKKNNVTIPPPADPNYPNVSFIHAPMAQFLVPEKVDLVWTSQNYHDLHDKFFGPVDVAAMNKAIFAALKPGGIFIVLDHAAQAGSGLRDTDTLHRIDPAQVKKEVEAAGFKFVGESNVLHYPDDNHTLKVFDAAVRGKTDQFIFKFRKPGKK
jgi:predicted methyltransferase